MEDEKRQKTAIVVGAGAGGVTTAAHLAKAGFKVTVFEKNSFTGGRCSLLHHEDYRFDRGPSLLLMPELFHTTFSSLDTSMEAEGIQLIQADPNYTVFYSDGTQLTLSTSLTQMTSILTTHEGPAGVQRFLSYLKACSYHYSLSVKYVLSTHFPSHLSLLNPSLLLNLLKLHPFTSLYNFTGNYFHSEKLRQAFTFSSMYLGISPFSAPATFSLLPYTEFIHGIWYPVGGFHSVISALQRVGERMGVTYQLNTPISQILLSPTNDRAIGVTLSTGEDIKSDVVVINADLSYAYSHLLPSLSSPSSILPTLPFLPPPNPANRKTSCSSISFYWSLSTPLQFPNNSAHNIFLPPSYKAAFSTLFEKNTLPDPPAFYIHVASTLDPTAAPEGGSAVVVLVPCGHLSSSPSPPSPSTSPSSSSSSSSSTAFWHTQTTLARASVLTVLSSSLNIPISSITSLITHESISTPLTWQKDFNLHRGSILGLSHDLFNVLSFRHGIRHPSIKNLYFSGASVQPGGGVPIVLRGAGVVLDCVLEDFGGMVDGNKALENGTGALANGNGVLVDGKEANGKLNSKMNGKMNGMMNGKSEDIMEDYRMGNANGSAREEEGRKTCGMRTLGMTMGARRKRWRQVLGLLLACMVVWLFGLYGRLGSAGGMLRT